MIIKGEREKILWCSSFLRTINVIFTYKRLYNMAVTFKLYDTVAVII